MARRTRLIRPYPPFSLEDALPIAVTIQEVNGGHPVEPELLADAMGTTARSSSFIQKLSSSAKYGLTVGAHTAERIELTTLGETLTAPRSEEERLSSLRSAALEPEVFRRFYEEYAGKRFPESPFAANTITRVLGVRAELADECLEIVRRNGRFAGIVLERAGALFVKDEGAAHEEPAAEYRLPEPRGAPPSEPAADAEPVGESGYVLVVSTPGDYLAERVIDAMALLSIPATTVDLDLGSARLVSEPISRALRDARGCALIWPSEDWTEDEAELAFGKAWAALGAASHQLGGRVVVIASEEDSPALAAASAPLELAIVEPSPPGGIHMALMSALVANAIVRVSLA